MVFRKAQKKNFFIANVFNHIDFFFLSYLFQQSFNQMEEKKKQKLLYI